MRFDALQSVPEPGSLALMSVGTIGGILIVLSRKRARKPLLA
jgi:PEP-CTERM motif